MRMSIAVALVCAIGITPFQNGEAQEDFFGAGVTKFAVVDHIRNSIESVIGALEASIGNNLFRSRQHLEIILDQVENVASNSTQTLFDKMSQSERRFFIDVARQMNALKELERVTYNHVSKVSEQISSSIVNLPFANNLPLVFGYEPLFVASGGEDNKEVITVTIRGALLASGGPNLVMSNSQCKRSAKIDTSLTFMCDKTLFLAEDAVETLTGTLSVFQKRGFWSRLFSNDEKKFTYDLAFNVIPKVLAKATIVATTTRSDIVRTGRSQRFGHRNGHCQGTRHMVFPFNAQRGQQIDPHSIRARCRSSSRSSCNGLRNVQARSFGYSCTVSNNGNCGPFWRDGRGSCSGTVEWQEIHSVESLEERRIKVIDVQWGKDEQIALPTNVERIKIAFEKVDGSSRIATDSAFSDPWVKVEIDIQGQQVIISPKSLANAMR